MLFHSLAPLLWATCLYLSVGRSFHVVNGSFHVWIAVTELPFPHKTTLVLAVQSQSWAATASPTWAGVRRGSCTWGLELPVLGIGDLGYSTPLFGYRNLCVQTFWTESWRQIYPAWGIFYFGLSPVRRTFSTGDGRMTHFWLIMRKTSSFFSSGAKNLPSVPQCGGKGIHSNRCDYTPVFVCSNVLTSLKKKKKKKRLIFL